MFGFNKKRKMAAARHILVADESLCQKLKDEIETDFAEVAAKHSTCLSSAKGGDLGTFRCTRQTIYKKNRGLDFTLPSVGIKAKGRTTILRLNYRNTREIPDFSYHFSSQYIYPKKADDDHIPLIEPEAAGTFGDKPLVRQFPCLQDDINYSLKCLQKWHQDGVSWRDMAIIYISHKQGRMLKEKMRTIHIPLLVLDAAETKKQYDRTVDQVTALTIHSSKGLEFPRVILLGVGELTDATENEKTQDNASLLYVGMTRAQECLLVTTSTQHC